MLEALFGNKNIQHVLLFLFVNGKCYGTQLHRVLRVPLTPIQKALARLEQGKIIHSYFEGKTKLYQFNQSFPLIREIEAVIKKCYSLLPVQEKKSYYVAQAEGSGVLGSSRMKSEIVHAFWKRLSHVKIVHVLALTQANNEGWNGKGKGEVAVIQQGYNTILFSEKGYWQIGEDKESVNFNNTFRWTFDKEKGIICLEHLRHGIDDPVFLFYLAPQSRNSLSSVDSHLHDKDIYFGHIFFDEKQIRLSWRAIGPSKNEEITYYYS